MKNILAWIDFLKGLGIFLVVYGHVLIVSIPPELLKCHVAVQNLI
ncbi:MAG: hypothetical protein WCG23_10935 [bacterium]